MIAILMLIGGTALLLYGMDLAGDGLQKFSAQKLKGVLRFLAKSRLRALLAGAVATVTLQSSGAASALLVGFVTSALLRMDQAFAVLLGSNIGTTLTVQILAFNLSDYALAAVAAGFLILKLQRAERAHSLGQGIMGFGLIFLGIGLMGSSFALLKETAGFHAALEPLRRYPLLALAAAAMVTALIHSSAAAIVLVMTLAGQGAVSITEALPMVLGANVGTCSTALAASMGRGPAAWRLSLGFLSIKVIGALLFFPWIPWFAWAVTEVTQSLSGGFVAPERCVANVHTVFNVAISLLFLPGVRQASSLLRRLVPDRQPPVQMQFEEGGLSAARQGIRQMADRAKRMMQEIQAAFRDNDLRCVGRVRDADEEVDLVYSSLFSYLTREAVGKFGTEATQEETRLLYAAQHLEHIGDLASKDLVSLARKKIYSDLEFSIEGQAALEQFQGMVYNLLEVAFDAFDRGDGNEAARVRELFEEAKRFKERLSLRHLEEVRKGVGEAAATSPIYLDVLADLEQICQYTSDIAAVTTQA